jgi:hypothetical protein
VATYAIPQTTNQYAGMLAQKFTLNTAVYLKPDLSLNPSFIVGGKRYAYTETDAEGNPVATQLDPYCLINLFLNHRNLLAPGLTVGIGVFDILNQHPSIPQAYNGAYAPIPGRSREFIVKLSYQLNFNKQ